MNNHETKIDTQMPTDKEAPKKAASGRFARFSFALLALALAAGAYGFVPRWHQQASLKSEAAERATPTVSVVKPAPLQSSTGLLLPAEIKPWVEAPLYARASGYLKARQVDIGSRVVQGQLLAEIDAPELQQQREQAKAQLAQAEAAMDLSKITAERWEKLVKSSSVSEQDNAEKQADYKLKTAAANQARAELRRLEDLVSFTRIMAPFSGTVTTRNVDVGDLITAGGAKELFHLSQTEKLRIQAQVPQTMAHNIAVDQAAEMLIPEMPGRVFAAKIVRTAGAMTADSRTLLVELEVDNEKQEILAGGYAQLRFIEAKNDDTLTLPSNAIAFRSEGPQIATVDQAGKVEWRTVKLGRDYGKTIEVLVGVKASDRVIVNPSDALATGNIVSPIEMPKPEKGSKAEKAQ
ncbi:MAG: efflux RND transporter periplasmic adaptor subunit [Alphaproteobacteria bacterium]|nr:efflux RND transporter periplasmic adaptor subunit [Alphaproteobacteria bacterium]